MAFQNILCEIAQGVATVTVNRPDKLNALNNATIGELHHCFAGLANDAAVRTVILTGAGEKAFVAGADIGELAELTARQGEELATRGQGLMHLIENRLADLFNGIIKHRCFRQKSCLCGCIGK